VVLAVTDSMFMEREVALALGAVLAVEMEVKIVKVEVAEE